MNLLVMLAEYLGSFFGPIFLLSPMKVAWVMLKEVGETPWFPALSDSSLVALCGLQLWVFLQVPESFVFLVTWDYLVFIWSCFVSCLLLLLYYVICAPVLTEGTSTML